MIMILTILLRMSTTIIITKVHRGLWVVGIPTESYWRVATITRRRVKQSNAVSGNANSAKRSCTSPISLIIVFVCACCKRLLVSHDEIKSIRCCQPTFVFDRCKSSALIKEYSFNTIAEGKHKSVTYTNLIVKQ